MAKRSFLMLAHTFRKTEPITNWFMSEKLDGMRCLYDGGITAGMKVKDVPWANIEKDPIGRDLISTGLWSRYGKSIQCPADFTNGWPAGLCLDGELYAGRGNFQSLVSATKKLTPLPWEWEKVTFNIIDAPPYYSVFANGTINETNYKKKFSQIIYDLRMPSHPFNNPTFKVTYDWLRMWFDGKSLTAKVHEQEVLPWTLSEALARVEQKMNEVVSAGGEGVMLRNPASFWSPNRVYSLLKVKDYLDAEGVIVGFTSGRKTDLGSKLLGKIGALIVSWCGKTFELSGLTDEERRLNPEAEEWAISNPGKEIPGPNAAVYFKMGDIVTFRYREQTDDGRPKEARYFRKYS